MGRRVARMRNCEKYTQNIGLETMGCRSHRGLRGNWMAKLKADVKCDVRVHSALSKVISLPQ